jgi:predicted dehydrogenase
VRKTAKRIGLAIVGAGRVGLFRGEVAARHPMVDFIGICDLKEERLELVQKKTQADYATTDFRKLLQRPEITAVIIATDEHLHVEPILAAVRAQAPLLIEKPLATELAQSQRVLDQIRNQRSTRSSATPSASAGAGWRRRRRCAPAAWATSRW